MRLLKFFLLIYIPIYLISLHLLFYNKIKCFLKSCSSQEPIDLLEGKEILIICFDFIFILLIEYLKEKMRIEEENHHNIYIDRRRG